MEKLPELQSVRVAHKCSLCPTTSCFIITNDTLLSYINVGDKWKLKKEVSEDISK